MHDDRRKHHRVTVTLAVDVTTSAESGTNFFAGATRDLSLGGIFLETQVSVPPGELVHVDLLLEGKHHSLPCEVVWELRDAAGQTVGFGARFLGLQTRTRHAIARFMKARAPIEYEELEVAPDDEPEPGAEPDPEPGAPPAGMPPLPRA